MPAAIAAETPAARARARRDPAVRLPPKPPQADRRSTLAHLHAIIRGRPYLIGPAIEGDPETTATRDGTATVTIRVRDSAGMLQEALDDEAQLLQDGTARLAVNTIQYVLQSVDVDETGTLVTLVVEDEVSWRLKQFTSFRAIRRSHANRAQAVAMLADEASAPPLAPMRLFIPEIDDRQRISAPAQDTTSTRAASGTGSGSYTVKGARATSAQRAVIDAILTEVKRESASARVMTAAIMTATQESVMGEQPASASGRHLGPFHQDAGWGTASERRDPTRATRAFLAGWKRAHGSLRNAPGALADAIEQVQRSGQPRAYAQWEGEASRTVRTWQGTDDDGTVRGGTVAEPYEFTRGERDGARESSWDAIGRWAQDVGFRRWAEFNTLAFASDEELRAAAPALTIHGDEPWLLSGLGYRWSPDRPITQLTIAVLAERWGVQIGASVLIATGTPARGRYVVSETAGTLVGPRTSVTLTRPAPKKPEPAHTTRQRATSTSSTGASGLLAAAKEISGQNRAYVWGGGHGKPLTRITAHEGLDCSSAVSLALFAAGLFGGRTTALVSGEFAAGFGEPGRGREFTIWANGEHVWIEFHHAGQTKRFDTSPYGSGPSGPHTRTTARNDQTRFTARHVPGH